MKEKLKFIAALAAAAVFTGCSHNPAVFTFGKQIRVGTIEYGDLSYLNGVAIVDISRENSEWEIEIDEEDGISIDPATNSVKGIKKIRRSIGRQMSGYLNDLAKKDPEAVEAVVKYLNGQKEETKPETKGE